MRIVAGTLKGRPIAAPAGDATRPTTDRVREALFSSLYSLLGAFEGLSVLDAFAGSGALGIEALSRGARRAVFFERDPKAAAILKRNIASCGLASAQAQVVQRDVFKALPSPAAPAGGFGLVFLDPPYAYEPARVLAFVRELHEGDCLAPGAVVAYEHALSSKDDVMAAADACGFDVVNMRKYGKTNIATLELP